MNESYIIDVNNDVKQERLRMFLPSVLPQILMICEYSTDCYHFPQDMALIEALWKQDVDLGVPREVFEEEGPPNNSPDPTKDKDHGKKVWQKFILYPEDNSAVKDMLCKVWWD